MFVFGKLHHKRCVRGRYPVKECLAVFLELIFVCSATGIPPSQHSLGGRNTQDEFSVLLWPLTLAWKGVTPKLNLQQGTMRAQIIGQVANQQPSAARTWHPIAGAKQDPTGVPFWYCWRHDWVSAAHDKSWTSPKKCSGITGCGWPQCVRSAYVGSKMFEKYTSFTSRPTKECGITKLQWFYQTLPAFKYTETCLDILPTIKKKSQSSQGEPVGITRLTDVCGLLTCCESRWICTDHSNFEWLNSAWWPLMV